MTQTAMKPPTCQKFQPSTVYRKTGRPTTNQTSREANRKTRAAASMLTARLFENIWLNLAFLLAVPEVALHQQRGRDQGGQHQSRQDEQGVAETDQVEQAGRRRRSPTPLSAFFEPVRIATHLNSVDCASSATTNLMALLELIFVRSLAMPEKRLGDHDVGHGQPRRLDQGQHAQGDDLRPQAANSVVFSPSRAASQPPTRFVTMPKTS